MKILEQEKFETTCGELSLSLVGSTIDHARFGLVEVLEESPNLLRVEARETGLAFWIPRRSTEEKKSRLRKEKLPQAEKRLVCLFSRPGSFYVVSDRLGKILLLDDDGKEFQVAKSDVRKRKRKSKKWWLPKEMPSLVTAAA